MGTSPHGNKNILMVTGLFTTWVFRSFSYQRHWQLFYWMILSVAVVCILAFTVTRGLLANLWSSVIHSVCQPLGIVNTRTSAYHLQRNGQVEQFNRTVEAMRISITGIASSWRLFFLTGLQSMKPQNIGHSTLFLLAPYGSPLMLSLDNCTIVKFLLTPRGLY